jgi:hypothetical protein
MENFNQIKQLVLERAKPNGACSGEFKRALQSENLSELCQVLKDNFFWGCQNNVITHGLIEQFKEDFAQNEIWSNQNVSSGFCLASGNATVRASSNATVRASGNATVRAWDNATVEASGNATVEAWDNATVRASGNATVEAWDNAYILCRTTIKCKISDKAIIRRWDINTIQYCDPDMKFEKVENAPSEK